MKNDLPILDRIVETSAQAKKNLCFGEKVCKNATLLNPLARCQEMPNPSPFCLKSFCCCCCIFEYNLITADTLA